jgi:hypothetical protein
MKSSATSDFWEGYRALPPAVRSQARKAYRLWLENPRHPSLRFDKKGHYWSARISPGYRAFGGFFGERTRPRVQSATPSSLTSESGFSVGAEPCARGRARSPILDTAKFGSKFGSGLR